MTPVTNTRPRCGSAAVVPQFEPPWLPGIEMLSPLRTFGLKRPPCGPVPFFALRTRSLSASYCSGVSSYGLTSSSVNDCRTNGAGFVGNGCVGHDCSNGTSLFVDRTLLDRPERLAR